MLAPCYLVHGGELLQTEELIYAIKQLAGKHDYTSCVVFEINAQFDWEQLLNKCQTLDLFAEKSIVEIRLHSENIGKHGTLILESILRDQTLDTCIILRAPKLKAPTLNTTWVKHIQKHGQIQVAKAIPAAKWPAWISQRLRQAGFQPSIDVIGFLARCYEGNLPAAAQCINKLKISLTAGPLDLEQIKPFIENSTHFSVFDLTDAVINGDSERAFSILHSLKEENVDPILILWALARETRNLLNLTYGIPSGIWRDRLSTTKLEKILQLCTSIDSMIKGISPGNAWEPLLSVTLMLASSKTLTMENLTI